MDGPKSAAGGAVRPVAFDVCRVMAVIAVHASAITAPMHRRLQALKQALPLYGQCHRSSGPVEQAHAEFPFEPRDAAADRRRVDVQVAGCRGEVHASRSLHEDLHRAARG